MKNKRNLAETVFSEIANCLSGKPCIALKPLDEKLRKSLCESICQRFKVKSIEEIPPERSHEFTDYLCEIIAAEQQKIEKGIEDCKRELLDDIVHAIVRRRLGGENTNCYVIFSECCEKEFRESVCEKFEVNEIYDLCLVELEDLIAFGLEWELSEVLHKAVNVFRITEIFETEKRNDGRGIKEKARKSGA